MSNKILLPQLVSMLAEKSGNSKKNAEAFLKAFFAELSAALEKHETVKIKDLGTFKVNRIEARKSVNVSTGTQLQIPSHFRVVFLPTKRIAEKVNKEFSWLEVIEISENVSNEELDSVTDGKTEMPPLPPLPPLPPPFIEEEIVAEESIIPEKEPEKELITESESVVEEDNPEESSIVDNGPEEKIAENEENIQQNIVTEEKEQAKKEEYLSRGNYSIPVYGVNNVSFTESVPVDEPRKETDEQESEKLGEEIEKEFGEIEPAQPFGPIEPSEPSELSANDVPPEDAGAMMMADFDPYAETKTETLVPVHKEPYYVTKGEFDNLVSKADLKPIARNLKRVKATVDQYEEKSKKRSLSYFFWTLFICIVLIVGSFFLLYYLLSHRLGAPESQQTENVVSNPADDNDEYAAASVKGISNNETTQETTAENKNGEEKDGAVTSSNSSSDNANVAPTSPSDVIATDKVTNTRYLTTMAKEYYGNYNLWPYIYLENADKLGHPDRIKPGTPIVIPNLDKYGIDPSEPKDIEKAKKEGVAIYKKFSE